MNPLASAKPLGGIKIFRPWNHGMRRNDTPFFFLSLDFLVRFVSRQNEQRTLFEIRFPQHRLYLNLHTKPFSLFGGYNAFPFIPGVETPGYKQVTPSELNQQEISKFKSTIAVQSIGDSLFGVRFTMYRIRWLNLL